MLDIKLIRADPKLVRNNLRKRKDPENLKMRDQLIKLDKRWRQVLTELNELRHERRLLTTDIAALKKNGENADHIILKARKTDTEISTLEKQVNELEDKTVINLMENEELYIVDCMEEAPDQESA